MRVSVAGTGYVGLVTAACLADTGNSVLAYDIDEDKVGRLREGECPIFEPGLGELLLTNAAAQRLRFTTDLAETIAHAEVVFIAIGTPSGDDGAADTSAVERFGAAMSPLVASPTVVATKSTVPVGTGARLEELLNARSRNRVHVVSNPEFLKEGSAVSDFQRPDRVLIGAEDEGAANLVRELYLPFVRNQRPILMMPRPAAELAKYAANACLAARISFINEVANICEALGVDVDDVRRGMGTDQRIGFQFLYPGAGYGGSCFPKDVLALAHAARRHGVTPTVLDAVHEVNEKQKTILFRKIKERFGDDLRNLTVALWGVAFKPNTDDLREAPALTLIEALLQAGAAVRAHDPEGLTNLKALYGDKLTYCDRAYDAVDGASCLVICTEWNEFRSPDFGLLHDKLATPVVFDGRSLYDRATLTRYQLEYYAIGKPPVPGPGF